MPTASLLELRSPSHEPSPCAGPFWRPRFPAPCPARHPSARRLSSAARAGRISRMEPMTTSPDARRLVDKLWSYCNILRDDGVGVVEYTEQLTYLLFLKM